MGVTMSDLRRSVIDAALHKESASGDIVTFNTNASGRVSKLVASFSPIQDLHGYDNPWPEGGGKNLLPYDLNWYNSGNDLTSVKAFWVKVGEYSLSFIDSSATSWRWYIKAFNADKTEVSTAGDEISGLPYSAFAQGYQTEANVTNKKISFTVLKDCNLAFGIRLGDGTTSSTFTNCQLETGTQQTSYAPFSNICPISGRTGLTAYGTGANVFGGTQLRDKLLSLSSSITTGTDSDGDFVSFPASAMSGKIVFDKFKAGTRYTIILSAKKNNTSRSANLRFIYDNGSVASICLSSSSVTANTLYTFAQATANSMTVKALAGQYSSGTTKCYYNNTGIFEGVLTTKDFTPYVGSAYPVSWQTQAGTVYGGTIDIVSGLLTATYGIVDLGTLNYTYKGTYKTFVTRIAKKYGTNNYASDRFNNVGWITTQAWADGDCLTSGGLYDDYLRFKWTKCGTDPAVFKAAASGSQICYELKTPQTYQLNPTQVRSVFGTNNFWSDSGPVSVEYWEH